MPTLLDVGCGPAGVLIPSHYQGWTRVRLDIDPACKPDIVLDARSLHTLPARTYDAVLCGDNIEHFFRHDGMLVAKGILHVLKADGVAEFVTPDLEGVMRAMIDRKLDLDDVLYQSPVGPIEVHDVLYGYQREIRASGHDFYAHRTGFTRKSMLNFLKAAGFGQICVGNRGEFTLVALAFVSRATPEQMKLFGLPENMFA